jgi:acyl-CoA thioesterase
MVDRDDGSASAGLAAARAMWAADAASSGLGMELLTLSTGRASVRMAVTEAMVNGHAIAHGGFVFALADSAFALACNSHGPVTVAAGCDITFVAPARLGDVLVAEAVERAVFGRSGLTDVSVRVESTGVLVAELRGRSRTIGPAS